MLLVLVLLKMHLVHIWIFLFLLTLNSLCQLIECDWAFQWLCGDKCIHEDYVCICGNKNFTQNDVDDYNCCNQGTCSQERDGNVRCPGSRQDWKEPCNGTCKQHALWGHSTILCADQTQCVESVYLCRGVPMCRE